MASPAPDIKQHQTQNVSGDVTSENDDQRQDSSSSSCSERKPQILGRSSTSMMIVVDENRDSVSSENKNLQYPPQIVTSSGSGKGNESEPSGSPEDSSSSESDEEFNNLNDIDFFFGVEAIDRALQKIYFKSEPTCIYSPDLKYWAGGDFPLDYVKVYKNTGNTSQNIKPHWHYVTYGLTDLHGDGRVHTFIGRGQPSGVGLELTFRLAEGLNLGSEPPYWPVKLLNNLARYVFNTGVELREYDHIPWHESLDRGSLLCNNRPISSGQIRHMLLVEDPQILNLDTPHGTVHFLQVVGILEVEFHYARSWRACAIIDQLLEHPQVGRVLVTDISRQLSVFDLNPLLLSHLHSKMEEDGSHLGRVTAHLQWRELRSEDYQEYHLEQPELELNSTDPCDNVKGIHIEMEPAAAELLPLMVKGRLKHNLPFTFYSIKDPDKPFSQTVEFLAKPHSRHPFQRLLRAQGTFIQILVSPENIEAMVESFKRVEVLRQESLLPLRFIFNYPPMLIVVVNKLTPNFINKPSEHSGDGGQFAP